MPRYYMYKLEPGVRSLAQPRVYLGEVDADCKVYLFAFDNVMTPLNTKLHTALTKWGKETGKNLFVGFWAEDDPRFPASTFNIETTPAIVITANPDLAFADGASGQSIYVKVDDQKMLQDDKYVDLAKTTLNRLYLLFFNGRVKDAIKQAKRAKETRKIEEFIRKLKDKWGSVAKFLDTHKIKIGAGPVTFESEPTGKS